MKKDIKYISDNDHNQWRTSLKVDDARAINITKFVNNNLASEASQKKILDFDFSNQPISQFGLHYCRQIIFFTVPLSKFIFFSQNQSKEIFFQNIPGPPPPQNIKWTVPKKEGIPLCRKRERDV